MERFICENVFVPLRSAPSHKSEMLSQILFGEKYVVIDRSGTWLKIKTVFDSYAGWIDINHLQRSEDTGDSAGIVLNRSLLCYRDDRAKLVLEAGCEIHNPDYENKTFIIGKTVYTTSPDFTESFTEKISSTSDCALKFMNAPYIWGGRVPSGLDCSGFTQLVYKICGTAIPRDGFKQAESGEPVSFIEETKAGDLVFFDNERGRISHVGLILSDGLVIHASGRVRIDTLDHHGIFKAETGSYSHRLRTIRRIKMART